MIYTIPDYYKEFSCVAQDCEDTCCAGWEIVIDPKSLHRYREVTGDYRRKLHRSVCWRKKVFRQDREKRCAFLKEDNLCEIYQVLGEDSLCKTCRTYPRHIEEYENVREITLSVSCPEAARLLMKKKEPVTFVTCEKPGEEEYEDFDLFLYSQLVDARELLVDILQNRDYPLHLRATLMLGLSWDVQNRVRQGNLFSCGEVLEAYASGKYLEVAGKKAVMRERPENRYTFAKKLFPNLFRLEFLKKSWGTHLIETEQRLYRKGAAAYWETERGFQQWLKEYGRQHGLNWEVQGEQLLVYFISTYFCGAVYDERIFVNAQMAYASVFLIREMLTARWLRNEKRLDFEDLVEIVYRYSRELEHSDENRKLMENMLEQQKSMYL